MICQPAVSCTVLFGNPPQPVHLVANHRAWCTLELSTGQPFRKVLDDYLQGESVGRFYPVLWGLMASWRAGNREHFPFTPEERELGWNVPGAFLDVLPADFKAPDSQWQALKQRVYDLLVEAGAVAEGGVAPDPLRPVLATAALSAGTGSSTKRSRSSASRKTSSGR